MNKLDKRVAPALAAAGLGVLLLASGAAWAAGEQDDPLITLGYLNKVALPQVVEQVEERTAQRQAELEKTFDEQLALYRQQAAQGSAGSTGGTAGSENGVSFTLVTLSRGQTMSLEVGCELLLRVGSASVNAATSPALTDMTTGGSIDSGTSLTRNHLYIATIPDRTLTATADTVRLLVRGGYSVT